MGSGGSFLNENTPLSERRRPAEERWCVWRETLTLLEEGGGGEEEEEEEEHQERSLLPIVS